MMRYTESQLEGFTRPISESENQRCQNMIRMVKEAIQTYYNETRDNKMSLDNYKIFLQGSYANNTNVKQNSDVDICVMYKNVFRYHMPDGYSLDGRYSDSTLSYMELRNSIKQALIKKFGSIAKMEQASLEEFDKIIPHDVAVDLKKYLEEKNKSM